MVILAVMSLACASPWRLIVLAFRHRLRSLVPALRHARAAVGTSSLTRRPSCFRPPDALSLPPNCRARSAAASRSVSAEPGRKSRGTSRGDTHGPPSSTPITTSPAVRFARTTTPPTAVTSNARSISNVECPDKKDAIHDDGRQGLSQR